VIGHQDSPPYRVIPDLVVLARESRGLSQAELADLLKVTQSRVSKIEAGLLNIPDDLLATLARILDYPPHFFFQEGRPLGMGIPELFHRKRQDVPKRILDKVYAQMDIRFRHVTALLRAADISCTVPHLDIDDFGGHPEEVARMGWMKMPYRQHHPSADDAEHPGWPARSFPSFILRRSLSG
jgi:transcriptional regulator with XRE-family HTH domain